MTLYSSCVMYFSLNVMIAPAAFRDPLQQLSTHCLFLNTFTLFIAMTTSASMVPEASAEVASIALTIPDDNERLTFKHLRFIMTMERELVLTVWKITPVKRNFIFGIAGILFTYTLMLYTLNPIK
ncbi:hypothetical protein NPIL_644701 [Nephila pilipes]|uniref:Uncharacterized protein n=1 Tax=Nephila pilipes TaxID=299642 RepID=A0A8X6TFI5_NEPPI|nr:hypothetical protein NPIL_644701 [Nephila pilipes]